MFARPVCSLVTLAFMCSWLSSWIEGVQVRKVESRIAGAMQLIRLVAVGLMCHK